MILVVSTPDDPHADAVMRELARRGERAQLLDVSAVLSQRLRATVGERALRASVGAIVLDDVESIWLRRVGSVRTSLVGESAAFAGAQAVALMRSLGAWLSDRRWLNPLAAGLSTDGGCGKLSQLEIARRSGLEIPETIATNSPDEARAFVAAHPGAVFKPLESLPRNDSARIYVTPVPPGADLSSVAGAPCLFQERVPKRCDVRGLVLGDRVLAAEIHSQDHPGSAVDFRARYALGETKYARHELPADVAEKVVRVHRSLGLVMGVFDLVHRPDGRYVFLETNQQGNWLWLHQQVLSLGLVGAVAEVLAPLGV